MHSQELVQKIAVVLRPHMSNRWLDAEDAAREVADLILSERDEFANEHIASADAAEALAFNEERRP